MMKVKKIVSHKPPRHLDDFLAIALLKERYPEAEVEYIHPQEVPESYYEDPRVILVDVGERYEPQKGNLDHHQDSNIPCSLVLVLKYLGEDTIKECISVKQIDIIDRFGFQKAVEKYGTAPNETTDELRRIILLSNPADPIVARTFKAVAPKARDINEFIKLMYEELDRAGHLEEAKVKIEEEEKREFRRKLSQAQIKEIGGLRIAYSQESFAPLHYKAFQELQVDLIIERNSMNSAHTSIIKNTSSSRGKEVDLSRVFSKYEKVFLHSTGFIAVINEKVENVNTLEISKLLTE